MNNQNCKGCDVREKVAKTVTGEGFIDGFCKGCQQARRQDSTICFWEGGKDTCRKCRECREHYS